MQPEFRWSRLADLTAVQLHAILKAREAVFVVEQRCAYQETDDMDLQAWHLSVVVDGALAAYARVVDPGVKFAEPSIGRVMTVATCRARKLGRALMGEAIRFSEQAFPGAGIRIGAQVHLQAFYASLGFVPVGSPYDEDGIMHVDMVRPAASLH